MMNKIIALAIKFSGAGWVFEKIDGMKTNLGVATTALGGAALVLSGAANLLTEIQACESMSCIIGIARGLGENPNTKTLITGWLALGGALGIGGIAHKIIKAEAKTNPS